MPLSLQPTSLDRVRDTFINVLFAKERAAKLFYDRLFTLAPETRALFRDDLEEQGRMFVEALSRIVTGLDRLENMIPELQALAGRHVCYCVEERHYAIVGKALLHMVYELSDPAFDVDTQIAWAEAYGLISKAMIEASHFERPQSGDSEYFTVRSATVKSRPQLSGSDPASPAPIQ